MDGKGFLFRFSEVFDLDSLSAKAGQSKDHGVFQHLSAEAAEIEEHSGFQPSSGEIAQSEECCVPVSERQGVWGLGWPR